MPQLDKLTFTSQIFWFFLLFVFLYYGLVQVTLLRLKFILGLKRFFFQADKNNSFYELSKKLKVSSRYNLLFFFDFYNLKNSGSDSESNFSFELLKNNSNNSMLSGYIELFFKSFESFFNSVNKFISNLFSKTDSYYEYNFVLDLNKSAYVYSYIYVSKNSVIELKDFESLSKSVNYFYEQFLNVFSFFFKTVQFYIFDTIFLLFYYFFNIFFKFREILYFFKLVNKLSV